MSELQHQIINDLFTYTIIVVDNDEAQSAKSLVKGYQASSGIPIEYYNEPEQNISLARNKAVVNAKGDFIAFIDDDEIPEKNWLISLLTAIDRFDADGILGPVIPYYDPETPRWVLKGRFYERPTHETGMVLNWIDTRTGNALIKSNIFQNKENLFKPEFGRGGEDKDFFRRLIEKKYRFVWCAQAKVYEKVPLERCKRSFMLKRALLRGHTPYNHNLKSYLKSLAAIPIYSLLLPFLIIRHHIFMTYLVKYFDHIGRILSLFGINVITDKYVFE